MAGGYRKPVRRGGRNKNATRWSSRNAGMRSATAARPPFQVGMDYWHYISEFMAYVNVGYGSAWCGVIVDETILSLSRAYKDLVEYADYYDYSVEWYNNKQIKITWPRGEWLWLLYMKPSFNRAPYHMPFFSLSLAGSSGLKDLLKDLPKRVSNSRWPHSPFGKLPPPPLTMNIKTRSRLAIQKFHNQDKPEANSWA